MFAVLKNALLERRLAWTPRKYAFWRTLLGAYLFVHFALLVPSAMELWSQIGALPHAEGSLFALADGAVTVTMATVAAAALALLLAAGWGDRTAAVLLWLIQTWMAARNPLTADAGTALLGWLLLAHALVPPVRDAEAEPEARAAALRERLFPQLPFRKRPRAEYWHFPPLLWAAAWIVVAALYIGAGYAKLMDPTWQDGSAMTNLIAGPFARHTVLRELLLELPWPFLSMLTWSVLLLELAFAPLALVAAVRPWLWVAMGVMQCLLLMLLDSTATQLATLLMHLMLINPAWFPLRLPHRHPATAWRDAHA